MAHWKLTLMYDGSAFHGWQVQPGLRSVQGTLAGALARLTGEAVLPQGSGRTDAGVHALGQVCSFTLQTPLPPVNLQRALNRLLPSAIRVASVEQVPSGFHARHSACRKTYLYRLFARRALPPAQCLANETLATGGPANEHLAAGELPAGLPCAGEQQLCPPFLAPFVWDVRWPLDLARMQVAAALLCGTHDFTSFAASDPDRRARRAAGDANDAGGVGDGLSLTQQESPPAAASPVRTIFHSVVEHRDDLLLYRVTGSGFLHHMVRNLVGTLVDVGRGRRAPSDILSILAARNRGAAGPTAPARGLFLLSVEYPEGAPETRS